MMTMTNLATVYIIIGAGPVTRKSQKKFYSSLSYGNFIMSEMDLKDRLDILGKYNFDIKERRIYLCGAIGGEEDDEYTGYIIEHIHFLNSLNHDPIQLILNSPGGTDDTLLYLYDAITTSQSEVITIGSGMVCSAASLVLACGDKRYATENCKMMTHKGQVVISGDDDEIHSQSELQTKLTDLYWKLLARHSTKTADQWYSKSKDEGQLWLNAEEMLKWGVIDGIIKPTRRDFTPLPTRKLKRLIADLEKEEEEDTEEE